MTTPAPEIPRTTRPLQPSALDALRRVQQGQRIRITQTVRVGVKSWPATVTGTYRGTNALVTGLATQRVPEDDIIVPIVHFTKENGELSSVTLDENTLVEIVESGK